MPNVRYNQFKTILDEAINSDGEIALPNSIKIEDSKETIKLVIHGQYYENSAYRMRLQNFDPPVGRQTHEIGYYPKIFINRVGMGSVFDGSGVILANNAGYKFHICDHDWDETGANHYRGWHPMKCKRCGVDASIDSGD